MVTEAIMSVRILNALTDSSELPMSIASELKKKANELAAQRVSNFDPHIDGAFHAPDAGSRTVADCASLQSRAKHLGS
jgi:hypothetical protein